MAVHLPIPGRESRHSVRKSAMSNYSGLRKSRARRYTKERSVRSQPRKRDRAMKAYSQDLRAKVLRAVDQGYPREEIVKLLGVSRATIKRYLRTAARNGNSGA